MSALPRLLVSSVVRGARQGDSHGGLYVVDLDGGAFEQVLDWNDGSIDFDGRGADRGLRGVAVCGDDLFIAASDELFRFDKEFKIVDSYRNPYLKHCHEMSLHGGALYLTSTGFNAILRFDLEKRRFDLGLALRLKAGAFEARSFDPQSEAGPRAGAELHLNNVHVDATGIYVSGLRMPALLRLKDGAISLAAPLPTGTHNARPFRGGVLFNDTERDRIVWLRPDGRTELAAPRYAEADLLFNDVDTSGIARQAFGRGLCPLSDRLIAAGSSPTTVSVYDLGAGAPIASLNLTMDVRNAAHGLAVWPF